MKAGRVRAILDDHVFKDILADCRQDQIDIFLAPLSTDEQIGEARLRIRAMDDLTDRMQRVLHDAQIAERRTKK